ncbi:fucosyltransferase, partial [Helicobacter pylori]|nr:fucosyltransferase [Helicobacter pylori]
YQDLSFEKILDFFKTILENDTIYHCNDAHYSALHRDLNEPLVSVDGLREELALLKTDYKNLKSDYERLLQNASPLLSLSLRISRRIYQKSLSLLKTNKRWTRK